MPKEHHVKLNKTHSSTLYPLEKGSDIIVKIEAVH